MKSPFEDSDELVCKMGFSPENWSITSECLLMPQLTIYLLRVGLNPECAAAMAISTESWLLLVINMGFGKLQSTSHIRLVDTFYLPAYNGFLNLNSKQPMNFFVLCCLQIYYILTI